MPALNRHSLGKAVNWTIPLSHRLYLSLGTISSEIPFNKATNSHLKESNETSNMKRFWLWGGAAILLVVAGCGAKGASPSSPANSTSRIEQVFNDGQKIVVNGRTDGRSHVSLVIGKLHWTAKGSRPDEFTASLEPSSEVPPGQKVARKGFVFNVGDSRFYIPDSPTPAGELVLRKNSQIGQQGGDFIVADMVQKNGQKVPVIVRLQP